MSGDATRGEALLALRRAFAGAGLGEAALDARLLLAEALGLDAVELALRPDLPVGAAGALRLSGLARRRLAREPVARLFGRREFWGLPFVLSPETLVPRPDSEAVVEAALAAAPLASRGPLAILDLGTGSGCLLVALLVERPGAAGTGVDRSPAALAAARQNAERNGVAERAAFVCGDWGTALAGRFDLILSNPPYIARADLDRLEPEVWAHDPALALDGGPDGLDSYRSILLDTARLLAPGGSVVLEIGQGQAPAVAALAAGAGLDLIGFTPDLAGIPRAVTLRSPPVGGRSSKKPL